MNTAGYKYVININRLLLTKSVHYQSLNRFILRSKMPIQMLIENLK